MRRFVWVLWFAVYLGVAVWSTWPLSMRLTNTVPLGTEETATVPLLNVWTLWWNVDRLQDGYKGYWDAPIFYPTDGSFALSEPMVPLGLAAPIVWCFRNPVPAYNCVLLLALALNGLSTFQFLRRRGLDGVPAFCGGLCVELLPLVHRNLGVLQLVPLFGVVWTIDALWQFRDHRSITRGVVIGAAFAFTYLFCCHYGLFLSVLLLVSSVWLLGRSTKSESETSAEARFSKSSATWLGLFGGLLVCVLLTYPVIHVQRQVMERDDAFRRPERLMSRLSARMTHYAIPPWPQLWPLPRVEPDPNEHRFPLCPGTVKLLLAAVGAITGLCWRKFRRWAGFCLTLAVAAMLLSLGPRLQIGGWTPYQILVDWYPGFAHVRNVFRFAVFVQLVVAWMTAVGLQAIWMAARRLLTAERTEATTSAPASVDWDQARAAAKRTGPQLFFVRRVAAVAVVLLVGTVAAMEIVPPSQKVFVIPRLEENRLWLNWLTSRTPRDTVLACVPFPKGKRASDYQETTVWMYWQTFHHRRMVNGYSGFFPQTFLKLKPLMAGFPHPKCLDRLEQLGVDYCVVRRSALKHPETLQFSEIEDRLVCRFSDDVAGIDIFHLKHRTVAIATEK